MNTKRLAVGVGATAGLVGAVALGAFAFGAAGLKLPEPPSIAIQAAATNDAVDAAPAPTTTAPAEPTAEPVAEPVAEPALELDPTSPKYNPYLTPGDPEYLSEQTRMEWLGEQQVVRACMQEAGFDYLVDPWWIGGQAQPKGLDYETSILWLQALYGGDAGMYDGSAPWEDRGCIGRGEHEAELAREAGTPLTAPIPPIDPARPTQREVVLAYHQLTADCMAEQGFEYRVVGWWQLTDEEHLAGDPARPADLTAAEVDAWNLALYGDAGLGSAYRWEDAGCAGYATHASGQDNMH
ncbi:hypothetical protein [Agromyces archimandritae]|uniref:Uncharacterized protein n=1 Tax=Agromyces archimandritae TaxID=2781962 RepID=A0A975IRC1_9MICO|nr:hypothetical protein [Agromyces archimandritae]QTX05931.1 hypothetical protein G127AT_06995 [Agromyces archimandritae]